MDKPGGRALRKSLRTDFSPSLRLRLIRAAFRAKQARRVPSLLLGGELTRPVFIVGAPRSGTSLLYAILRTSMHFDHWPGEAHEVWEADYHPALRGWESNVLDAGDLRPDAARRIRRAFFLAAGRRRRLLDKTPRNCFRIPFVDALFPDACFVFLQRDGRENINSLINAWRTPRYRTYRLPQPHRIPGVDPSWWKFVLYPGWRADSNGPLEVVSARQWQLSNDHALRGLRALPGDRWTRIRYEDLVAHPAEEVGRLTQSLGVAYDEDVAARAVAIASTPINTVTPPERGKWKRENPAEIEAVLPLIDETMSALGY